MLDVAKRSVKRGQRSQVKVVPLYPKTPARVAVTSGMVRADKIGSVTVNLALGHDVQVVQEGDVRVGDVIAVRVISEHATYNQIELPTGRLARLNRQDVVVGAIGSRKALKGFVGEAPTSIAIGEKLHILNLGGVIGRLKGTYQGAGTPVEVSYLGVVHQSGRRVNIADNAMPLTSSLAASAPLVLVAGTCMHAGKTMAASEIIKQMTSAGYRVAAAKLSGIACMRDTLNMADHGAIKTMSFHDCGLPSTVGIDDIGPVAKTIIQQLNSYSPDAIVIELGDGIIGGYNVDSVFRDEEIARHTAALIFCASDFVGAWGGIELMKSKGWPIDVIAGSVTDSPMGIAFIEKEFGVSAANAVTGGRALFGIVESKLREWRS